MRRITVSLDSALVELAEAEVAAGRAPSVSAWVAAAIRFRAQARTELVADLVEQERQDPTPQAEIAKLARVLGLPSSTVKGAIQRPGHRSRQRRAS